MAAISRRESSGSDPMSPRDVWSLPHSPSPGRSFSPTPRGAKDLSMMFSPTFRSERSFDFIPAFSRRSHDNMCYSPPLDDNEFCDSSDDEVPIVMGTARRPSITISRASDDRGDGKKVCGFPSLDYLLANVKSEQDKDDSDVKEEMCSTVTSQLSEESVEGNEEEESIKPCDDISKSVNHSDAIVDNEACETEALICPITTSKKNAICEVKPEIGSGVINKSCAHVCDEQEVIELQSTLPGQVEIQPTSRGAILDLSACQPGSGNCGSAGNSDRSPSSGSGGSFPDSPQASGCWCCPQTTTSTRTSQRKPDRYNCLPGQSTSGVKTQRISTTSSKSKSSKGTDASCPEEPLLPKNNTDKNVQGCSKNNSQESEGCVNPQMTNFHQCSIGCPESQPDSQKGVPPSDGDRTNEESNSDGRKHRGREREAKRRPRGKSCTGISCTDGHNCDNIWNNIDIKKIRENGRLVIYFKSRPRSLSPSYRIHPLSKSNPVSPSFDRHAFQEQTSGLTLKVPEIKTGNSFSGNHLKKVSLL